MVKDDKRTYFLTIAIITLSLAGYLLLGYFTNKEESTKVILLYTAIFALTAVSYLNPSVARNHRLLTSAGILFRISLVFTVPLLSDDYLRFIWDGAIIDMGINPYSFQPSEVMSNYNVKVDNSVKLLVLSKDYYSIYPPVCQFIFVICYKLSANVLVNVIAMKAIFVAFEIGSIVIIKRLLASYNYPTWWVLLYALNPLIIIELSGNLHFETLMIFFTLLSVWLLSKNRWLASSVSFGLAIATKLIPIVLLIFFIRRLGAKRFILFAAASLLTVFIVYLPFDIVNQYGHIIKSAQLYFSSFESNGSIYYLIRWIGIQVSGHNLIFIIGPILGFASLGLIVWYTIIDKDKSWHGLLPAICFAITIYYLLATTVNPWYITSVVAFSLFTKFRFPIFWSYLVILSYASYTDAGFVEKSWVIIVEYSLLFVFIIHEVYTRTNYMKGFRRWAVLKAAKLKINRIQAYLSPDDKILDIGTGNGAVAHILKERGYPVQSLDVSDKTIFKEVDPIIYDGSNFPFQNNQFDGLLLLTVLHHTNNPEVLLNEAVRVSDRDVIIMEDVYTSRLQKLVTFFADSIVNMEFESHPHTNKTEAEWEELFRYLGLEIRDKRVHRTLLIFRQVTYWLSIK